MGLVFLTNDGELANLMLKAHQLPQTYQLKLKTLLTFEEIESLSRITGAQINRIKGKDAPWYEVTLSEARRDVLRNRLFQTGHPVEKIKRVKIGNLAMESLPTGHHRPLSEAEVATLRRLVQPGAAQRAATRQVSLPAILPVQPPAAIPVAIARRPFVKRRPFQPKPKPGHAARPNRASSRSESFRPNQNFKTERPSPTGPKSFQPPYQDSRPAADRPDFNSKNRPPRGPKSGVPWKSEQRPSEPGAFGRSKQKFMPGRPSGIQSGAPKHGGAARHKPNRGRFTGPKGRS
jgi:hypothetical protein